MDIRFNRIKVSNFLSLGDTEVELDSRGFVLVKGINRESGITQSNGSGKSSIFDAILWTLTGETMRGTSEVTNENTTGGTLCELDFYVDGVHIVIQRAKGHRERGSTCIVYEDGEILSDQTKKSQEVISSILPSATPQIIGSVILLGQGLPYKFTNLTPIKRKDLLEELSGSSTQIDKVKSQLDLEEISYDGQYTEKNQRVIYLDGQVKGLESTIIALRSQLESQKDSATIQSQIDTLQEEIVRLSQQLDTLETQKVEYEGTVEKLQSALDNLRSFRAQKSAERSQVGDIWQGLQSMKGNCPTCGRPYEVTDELLVRSDQLQVQYSNLDSVVKSLDVKMEGFLSQIQAHKVPLQNVVNQISSTDWTIQESRREIVRLTESLTQSQDLEGKINTAEDEMKSCKIESRELLELMSSLKEKVDCIGYLKRTLSKEFKGYMLQEVIDFMSTRSEYYSSYLFSNGKKITVTLSGNKILIQVGGRLYENLSGGERQRVDLAVQFALRDLLVTTSGFSCNLLVLDEAFDNLDAQGSESLVRLVTSEFSDIDSVFTVTHHSEIDIPYDTTLTVIKESNGISKIEEG